jgi:hypothetical protein
MSCGDIKSYISKNIKLASGSGAKSSSLKKSIRSVIAEAQKYDDDEIFYKKDTKVMDYLNFKKEIIYRDLEDYCPFPYHNRFHTEHVFDLTVRIVKPLVHAGRLNEGDLFVAGNSALNHDMRREISGIIQTMDKNISNEEIASLKQIEDDFYEVRPKYILRTTSCNLATTFGQGHPKDDTAREYVIESDVEAIVTFADISGFTHKKGIQKSFQAFFNDSINILKELPASKAMEWYPDFESWIGHPQMGAISFIENVITKRFDEVKRRGLLVGSLLEKIESDLQLVLLVISDYQRVLELNKAMSPSKTSEKSALHEYEDIFYDVMSQKENECR